MRRLQFFLLFSAFVWGVAIVGIFFPWEKAVEMLQGLGAGEIPSDPMLNYWLRMASGAFGLVGLLFLIFALHPQKYASVIPWFGRLMLLEGVILLAHGLRLHFAPFPFYADTAACFVGGIGVLVSARSSIYLRHEDA